MNQKKRFFILLSVLLLIALTYYFVSTDRTTDVVLIGTVDANQVIVSSKVVGRLETLNVDEGQNVKAGDLVATVDSAEYLAMRNAAEATLASSRTKIAESSATAASTQGDTTNQVANSRATLRAAQATLKVAIANRDLQEADTRRTVALADAGRDVAAGSRPCGELPARAASQRSDRNRPGDRRRSGTGGRHRPHQPGHGRRPQHRGDPRAGPKRTGATGAGGSATRLYEDFFSHQRNGERAGRAPGRSGERRHADCDHRGPDRRPGFMRPCRRLTPMPSSWAMRSPSACRAEREYKAR